MTTMSEPFDVYIRASSATLAAASVEEVESLLADGVDRLVTSASSPVPAGVPFSWRFERVEEQDCDEGEVKQTHYGVITWEVP